MNDPKGKQDRFWLYVYQLMFFCEQNRNESQLFVKAIHFYVPFQVLFCLSETEHFDLGISIVTVFGHQMCIHTIYKSKLCFLFQSNLLLFILSNNSTIQKGCKIGLLFWRAVRHARQLSQTTWATSALVQFSSTTDLRSDFVSANDEHHFSAPWIHKTGPAGIQYDIIPILSTKSNG